MSKPRRNTPIAIARTAAEGASAGDSRGEGRLTSGRRTDPPITGLDVREQARVALDRGLHARVRMTASVDGVQEYPHPAAALRPGWRRFRKGHGRVGTRHSVC